MERPTIALGIGLTLGGAILAGGHWNMQRLQREEHRLRVACAAEEQKALQLRDPLEPPLSTWNFDGIPDAEDRCHPAILAVNGRLHEAAEGETPLRRVQQELVDVHNAAVQFREWPAVIGVGVFTLFAVPWAWYFLLRRIRELREAVMGR